MKLSQMKLKLVALALAGVLAMAGLAQAEDKKDGMFPGEFSGSVALTTEYHFRGISQSSDRPAIQGSVDYGHDSGFYAGVWGSNVDFTDATIEIDFYAGVAGEVEKISWDIGAIYYHYPGAENSLNYDFWEAALSLGYDFGMAAVGAGVNWSPENFGDSGDAIYFYGTVEVPLPSDFTLAGEIGRYNIDKNDVFGVPDYTTWNVSISTSFKGVDLSLMYVDTNISETECGSDNCEGTVVFTISKAL